MAEWLRRWTVDPLGYTSVGSNPIFDVFLFGSMVKWIAICSLNSAIKVKSGKKKLLSLKAQPPPFLKFEKKTDDNVENNCLLYTSPSPRDATLSRMPSSA